MTSGRTTRRTAPPEIAAEVRLLVETEGVSRTREILGIAKEPIVRIAAGLPVQPGTVALAALALEKRAAKVRAELEATDREIARAAR